MIITEHNFYIVFSEAWVQAMTPSEYSVRLSKYVSLVGYLDSPDYRHFPTAKATTSSSIRVLTSAENLQKIHGKKKKASQTERKGRKARKREGRRDAQKIQKSQKTSFLTRING